MYTKESTTYDSLLAVIKEAESEWNESKNQVRIKSAVVPDREDEMEELKKRLDKLTATVKLSNVKEKQKGNKNKSPGNSPRKDEKRKLSRGPGTSSAGPFKPQQRPIQCYKCEGWGHGWRECATKGNVDSGRVREEPTPIDNPNPEKCSTVERDKLALRDLYHNPDPLFRLIGESNETIVEIIVENNTVKALIDSGAQVSSISDKYAKQLDLKIRKLKTLLELEPTGGGTVPYDGYVEVRMQILNVRAFDLDVLMLVIPERQYSKKIPITLGTSILTKLLV